MLKKNLASLLTVGFLLTFLGTVVLGQEAPPENYRTRCPAY